MLPERTMLSKCYRNRYGYRLRYVIELVLFPKRRVLMGLGCCPTENMPDSQDSPYQNPLIQRYSSREMAQLWGPQRRFQTWRRLWVALAESEKELGLPISDAQLAQLKQFQGN